MTEAYKKNHSLLLKRAKVCRILGISKREFYALAEAGKFHPIYTAQNHMLVPLAEVMAVKAELSHKASMMPWEKFIQAQTLFTKTNSEISDRVTLLGFPRPLPEYIDRLRAEAMANPALEIIRAGSIQELWEKLSPSPEIVKRKDLQLVIECLAMISKSDEEIAQMIRAKFGRQYTQEGIGTYLEYFFDWPRMDHESVLFYTEFLQGRERLIKECAYRRADYFVYYALGLDFGGEVGELLERICLGLLHRLNFLVDAQVYQDVNVPPRELQQMAEIISQLLTAAKGVRDGKMPKMKQQEVVEHLLPKALSRQEFFGMGGGASPVPQAGSNGA